MVAIQSIPDTTSAEHVLTTFGNVHPVTGNAYYAAIELHEGLHQDLVIYRQAAPRTGPHTEIYRIRGMIDVAAQVAPGNVAFCPNGSLLITFSGEPLSGPKTSKTGFTGMHIEIPGVEQPWTFSGAQALPVTALPPVPPPPPPATDPRVNELLKRVSDLEARNNSLAKTAEALRARVGQLEARPVGMSGDALWGFVNDAINAAAKAPGAAPFNTPEMVKWTREQAQENLTAALEYALTHSAAQSRLRSVISTVVAEEMPKI
jgi:hypothetical protein